MLGVTDELPTGDVTLEELAAELGIDPEVPEWAPHFQARPLTAYRPQLRGTFRYAAPFGEL